MIEHKEDEKGQDEAVTTSILLYKYHTYITLLTAEILSGKNARAWISIDFT